MKSEGRLEMFYENVWKTICYNGFDIRNAHVACRQLGYKEVLSLCRAATMMNGQGTGPIQTETWNCTGNENNLQDCKNNKEKSHNCFRYQNVGITCGASLSRRNRRYSLPTKRKFVCDIQYADTYNDELEYMYRVLKLYRK